MADGGRVAVRADDEVIVLGEVRELRRRGRELERLLGRKTFLAHRAKTQGQPGRSYRQADDFWLLPTDANLFLGLLILFFMGPD